MTVKGHHNANVRAVIETAFINSFQTVLKEEEIAITT